MKNHPVRPLCSPAPLCSVALLSMLAACSGGGSSSDPIVLSTDPATAGDLFDVQQAINDADPGDTVVVDAGTFEGRIVVTKSIVLVGQGAATVFTGVSGLADAAIEIRDAAAVEIRDVTVSSPNGGVRVRGCSDVLLEGVVASQNGDDGIRIRSSSSVVVRDCDAIGNLGYGVRVEDSSDSVTLEGLLVESNVEDGVEVEATMDFALRTSVVRDNLQNGVEIEDSVAVVVFDNDIENNVEYGVRVANTPITAAELSADNRITGNLQGNVRVE